MLTAEQTIRRMEVDDLMVQITNAVHDNNGHALEKAWHTLYRLDKATAVHVAYTLAPLSRVS